MMMIMMMMMLMMMMVMMMLMMMLMLLMMLMAVMMMMMMMLLMILMLPLVMMMDWQILYLYHQCRHAFVKYFQFPGALGWEAMHFKFSPFFKRQATSQFTVYNMTICF